MKLQYLLLGCLFTATASAQMDPHMDMGGHQDPQSAAFMKDMHDGMKRMDNGMASAPMTGDPDRDFAAMMIPHHQGAIDMAKTELKYGKDPVLRELAENIIAAQKTEIAMMERWLKDHSPQAK